MEKSPPRVNRGECLGAAGKPEGLLLGSLAIVPLILAAISAWAAPPAFAAVATHASVIWSGALLAFFAGVRRGLTFSEAAMPRPREIISMLWLFGLAIVTLWAEPHRMAIAIAMAGFVSVAALDGRAASRKEAPGYFALFRPFQAMAAVASLAIMLAQDLAAHYG